MGCTLHNKNNVGVFRRIRGHPTGTFFFLIDYFIIQSIKSNVQDERVHELALAAGEVLVTKQSHYNIEVTYVRDYTDR